MHLSAVAAQALASALTPAASIIILRPDMGVPSKVILVISLLMPSNLLDWMAAATALPSGASWCTLLPEPAPSDAKSSAKPRCLFQRRGVVFARKLAAVQTARR
jgi:hypothetical protein